LSMRVTTSCDYLEKVIAGILDLKFTNTH
jgi:hypothetical protein